MSRLVENSSTINWPIESLPDGLRYTNRVRTQNPEDDCKVGTFVEGTLKNNEDWNKHLSNECCCSICTCGKHMCKLQRIKPMGKVPPSNYKINFRKLKRIDNSPIKFPQECSPSKNVISESTYHAEFTPKEGNYKGVKSSFAGNLLTGGPLFAGTTYKQEYYPKVCTNIGPIPSINSGIFAMNLPMNANSSYNDTYRKHPVNLTESFKPVRRFQKSVSLDYVRGSTYGDTYKLPSIDNYKHTSNVPKRRVHTLVDTLSKKSEYQAEFIPSALDLCPAVVEVQRRTTVISK